MGPGIGWVYDAPVSDPRADGPDPPGPVAEHPPRDLPGERPPKRLLDQAPSERLGGSPPPAGAAGAAGAAGEGSPGRAVAFGLVAAAAGAIVHLAAATLLLWTGALLVVAVTIGIGVGLAVAIGAGRAMRLRTRRALALGLALGSIALAVGSSWALSGMYLGPLDYLAQVYGLLVPLQLALAAAGAVAGSR